MDEIDADFTDTYNSGLIFHFLQIRLISSFYWFILGKCRIDNIQWFTQTKWFASRYF